MVDKGLVKAGYQTFMLDDCYSLKDRDSNGRIVAGKKVWRNTFGLPC
jgi:alpha-galactosidase